jgi:hypothetical protein
MNISGVLKLPDKYDPVEHSTPILLLIPFENLNDGSHLYNTMLSLLLILDIGTSDKILYDTCIRKLYDLTF